jgi:haloalkane dehalogenase
MAAAKPLAKDVRAGLIAPYNSPRNRLATLKFVQDIPLAPDDPSGPLVRRVAENLDQLRQIPVQLVWGGRDFVFTRAYFDEWRRRLPRAEHHWLANAGHYLLEDQPDLVIDLIRRFLQRHPVQ